MISTVKKFLFVSVIALCWWTPAKAQFPLYASPANTVTVHSTFTVATGVSTTTIVIDLNASTTTIGQAAWPHKERRELNISSIRFDLDKVAASTATIKLGVVTFVSTTTGCVSWFYNKTMMTNLSNTTNIEFLNYNPNYLRLRVEPVTSGEGATPYLISNDRTCDNANYQSDLAIPSTYTGTPAYPGVGDVVLWVFNGGAASIVVNLDIQYSSDR